MIKLFLSLVLIISACTNDDRWSTKFDDRYGCEQYIKMLVDLKTTQLIKYTPNSYKHSLYREGNIYQQFYVFSYTKLLPITQQEFLRIKESSQDEGTCYHHGVLSHVYLEVIPIIQP